MGIYYGLTVWDEFLGVGEIWRRKNTKIKAREAAGCPMWRPCFGLILWQPVFWIGWTSFTLATLTDICLPTVSTQTLICHHNLEFVLFSLAVRSYFYSWHIHAQSSGFSWSLMAKCTRECFTVNLGHNRNDCALRGVWPHSVCVRVLTGSHAY